MSKFRLLIDGDMVEGELSMDVLNPATEEVVARCPRASKAQLDHAVAAAKAAFAGWSALSVQKRRSRIAAMAEIITANADELADLLTSEQGKPLPDAKREVMGMAAFFRALSAFDLPVKVLEENENRRVEAHRLPLGVVGAIIPWNFPLLTIGFKVPPALLAGNTVIVKPSPTTPLSTLRFAELVASILPRGVLNVIADANDLGEAMTGHPDVRKISFTGSTETGRKVMASASSTLKRMTLELGGNDAAIVLDDVDPKKIAPAIFRSAFFNSGQMCLAIKRLYVHEAVHEEMCAALVAEAKEWPVDNGLKQGAKIGPVQNRKQYERVKELLREARERGRILLGGNALDRPGYFIEPTIVTDVNEGSRLVDEEQFGPILPIMKFSDAEDAVARANGTNFGLGASVWSSSTERAMQIAKRLDAGTVWINKHAELVPGIPFGGAKQSGIGVEFAEEGLLEFTQLKIVSGPARERRDGGRRASSNG
jgi:acyl-CoA reductase-like NAD-dependent aldehyde dehydrogenase